MNTIGRNHGQSSALISLCKTLRTVLQFTFNVFKFYHASGRPSSIPRIDFWRNYHRTNENPPMVRFASHHRPNDSAVPLSYRRISMQSTEVQQCFYVYWFAGLCIITYFFRFHNKTQLKCLQLVWAFSQMLRISETVIFMTAIDIENYPLKTGALKVTQNKWRNPRSTKLNLK